MMYGSGMCKYMYKCNQCSLTDAEKIKDLKAKAQKHRYIIYMESVVSRQWLGHLLG